MDRHRRDRSIHQPSTTVSAPMSLIRIGVLGAGRGIAHARTFHALPESRTVALCDRRPARLAASLARFPLEGVVTYTDYAAFLRHDVDAVVVASGGPFHAEHVCLALQAGKHVLSELPMDYTLEGCRRVTAAVQQSG